MAASHHVGTRIQTQILCKNSKCHLNHWTMSTVPPPYFFLSLNLELRWHRENLSKSIISTLKMFGLQAHMWSITHMFAWIFTLVMSSELAFSYFYKLSCSIANTLTPKFILLQQKMEHLWVYMAIQYFRQMIITS